MGRLAVASFDHAASLEEAVEAVRSLAVHLFVERAQAASARFALTAENASAVAAIWGRLGGLPLAIELAAPRVKLLSPGALLGRLHHTLPLLTGGGRDVPARQQTLRSTVAWSYGPLDEGERALFARLGVFAGSLSLLIVRPAWSQTVRRPPPCRLPGTGLAASWSEPRVVYPVTAQ